MHLFLVVYVKGTIWKWIKYILGYILAFRLFPGNSRKCGNFDLLENRIFFSKLLIGGPFSEKLKHFLWPNLTLASSLLQYFAHNETIFLTEHFENRQKFLRFAYTNSRAYLNVDLIIFLHVSGKNQPAYDTQKSFKKPTHQSACF